MAEEMAMPDYPMGGSGNTTNNTAFRAANFDVLAGASYRQVIDVGNWDASTMTNAPGQSGDPRSPFYDNLLHGWANLEAFPLLFSREAVERHAVRVIRLQPIR
jgi:penicillin amidase